MKRLSMVLLAVAACDPAFVQPPPPPVPVATVTLTPDTATVIAGEGVQLTAALQDSLGNPLAGRTVQWLSLTPGVVSVSSTGAVTGLAPGAGRIIAAAEGKGDTVGIGVLPIRFALVGAGGEHSCAIGNNQRAYCWGYNIYGQVGVGIISFVQPNPAGVAAALRYSVLTTGGDHSCAVGTDGATHCWGRNSSGQLGRGATTGDPSMPAPVFTAARFAAVSAGEQHTCAVTADSLGYCWGQNVEGQLGDSQPLSRLTPVRVAGGFRFAAISAGALHNCALAQGGAAYCWGRNASGQLGDSLVGSNRRYPAPVLGGLAFGMVSAGEEHSCGITTTGDAYCWGDNSRGQLGTGTAGPWLAPAPVAGSLTFRWIGAGAFHTCALGTDGVAYCWGANDEGQVGDSSTIDRPTPVIVHYGLQYTALSAGRRHTCGVAASSQTLCWGSGGSGELGTGLTMGSSVPTPVAGPL